MVYNKKQIFIEKLNHFFRTQRGFLRNFVYFCFPCFVLRPSLKGRKFSINSI